MNTSVIWILLGLILSLLGTSAFLLIKKRGYEIFVQKCKNIEAPKGWSFYWLRNDKNKEGTVIRGFIYKKHMDEDPCLVLNFIINKPYKLGKILKIVFCTDGYNLLDTENEVYFVGK